TETLCSLLTARVVAGDESMLRQLQRELGGVLASERRHLSATLAEEELERRTIEPYHLLAADVKNGRGGLRTLHGLDWERRKDALTGQALQRPSQNEIDTRHTLLAVRNGLHASAGRALDVYEAEIRGPVAEWLGTTPVELGKRLYSATRSAERLADAHWPVLASEDRTDPVALTGRWVLRALRRRRAPEDTGSPLELALRAVEDRRGAMFTGAQEHSIAAAPAPAWTPEERSQFIRILASGRTGQRVVERLQDLGWMERAIPQWAHVVAAPQISPVHLHPVDTHLWRTVHELLDITSESSDEPWCREIAEDLGSLDEALLAALLHDIGKGLPGDHSVVGARLARETAETMGLDGPSSRLIEQAVLHHLLLPEVATRRDLGDRAVIKELAETATDLRMLQMLYLVSIADARATGPAAWSEWKSALMRTAFLRTAATLESSPSGSRWRSESIAAVHEAMEDPMMLDSIEEHVSQMPDGYLFRFEPDEIAAHLDLLRRPLQPDEARLHVGQGDAVTSITVATKDQPGTLATVAGVLALHNLSVVDAHISTRSDGVAIDSFSVVSALGAFGETSWPSVGDDIEAVLRGDLDLRAAVHRKATMYSTPSDNAEISVHGSNQSLVIEVRCTDRVGLLHDLAAALHELELEVDVAKVDTRGNRVVDVFYIRAEGVPASVIPTIKTALSAACAL
ncbi:MAG: ACT domain-containing protein, partial [Acidimicrobiia bacterium]|nr:ACT domain-containing protein [Acidimicrobiia bacterium]